MKLRFKFIKTGRLKYIGHLDLLNVWNRALKSARLPVSHSKGFNPHMLISFAAPLPLGLESLSEYVDIDFEDDMPAGGLTDSINERFPGGLEITGAYMPDFPYKRIASVVSRAEYVFELPYDVSGTMLEEFSARETIEVQYKTKRSNCIIDISPHIFRLQKAGAREITAVLSCGSVKNLKPASFIAEFNRFAESGAPLHKIRSVRTEILGEDTEGGFLPLSQYNVF